VSRFVSFSFRCETLLYAEAFETPFVLAKMETNEAGWLFVAHGFHTKCISPEREKCLFSKL